MPRYRAYGLNLESFLVLPGLSGAVTGEPDIVIEPADPRRFAAARTAIRPERQRDWFHARRLEDGTTYVRWTELFEFLLSPDGRWIGYRREPRARADSFAVYLLGQVLSFSLLARGIEALHATVVVVNGRAVAFVGECGYGKSTLAAAMLSRGFPLLTDDLMVLHQANGAWHVEPGVARIKLFPSVARSVLGMERAGTAMNDGTSKLVLPLDAASVVDSTVPLGAVYVLGAPEGPRRRRLGPVIDRLSGADAFLEVIRAAFNLIVTDRDRLANQFAFATQLSSSAVLRRVRYVRSLAALSGVCDALLADLEAPAFASAMNI